VVPPIEHTKGAAATIADRAVLPVRRLIRLEHGLRLHVDRRKCLPVHTEDVVRIRDDLASRGPSCHGNKNGFEWEMSTG